MAGLNNLGLGVVFSATDLITPIVLNISSSLLELDKRIADVTSSIQSHFSSLYEGVGGALESVSEDIFKFGLSAAVIGESFRMAFGAGELQRQIEAIRIQTGFFSGDMERISRSVMDMSLKTGGSTKNIAMGLRDFATAGLDAAGSITAMKTAMDMTAASFGDVGLSQAVEILTTSVNVFTELGGDMNKASDIMIRAVSRSKLKFSELAMGFSVIGKSAQGVGATLEDSFIALGEVRGLVPSMERASTGISSFMSKLQDASTQAHLRALGANLFDYSSGTRKLKPFLEVIAQIADATKKMSLASRSETLSNMFGTEALTGLVPLINRLTNATDKGKQNFEGYMETVQKWRKEIRTMGDDTATAAMKARGGFNELWGQLKNTFSVIGDEIGLSFIEALTPVLKIMLEIFKAIAAIVVAMPSWLKSSLAHMIVMASMLKLVLSSFRILGAIIPVITSNISKMTTAMAAKMAGNVAAEKWFKAEMAKQVVATAAPGVVAAATGGATQAVVAGGSQAAGVATGAAIASGSIWSTMLARLKGLGAFFMNLGSIALNFARLHPYLALAAATITGSMALYSRHTDNVKAQEERIQIIKEGNAEKLEEFDNKRIGWLRTNLPVIANMLDGIAYGVNYVIGGISHGVDLMWKDIKKGFSIALRTIEDYFMSFLIHIERYFVGLTNEIFSWFYGKSKMGNHVDFAEDIFKDSRLRSYDYLSKYGREAQYQIGIRGAKDTLDYIDKIAPDQLNSYDRARLDTLRSNASDTLKSLQYSLETEFPDSTKKETGPDKATEAMQELTTAIKDFTKIVTRPEDKTGSRFVWDKGNPPRPDSPPRR